MKILILALLLSLLPVVAKGETYKNIGPLDSLADIKGKFPKATYERVNAAWATETEVLYKITGEGMSGIIVVKFYDGRPTYKKLLDDNSSDVEQVKIWTPLVNLTDDEALDVSWVRWVPDYPIPLPRLISKYGKPEKKGFGDEDLQPYREWKRGLTAYLSDDEKTVVRIDYSFTSAELRRAWKEKHGFVPVWLKQTEPKKKKQKK